MSWHVLLYRGVVCYAMVWYGMW